MFSDRRLQIVKEGVFSKYLNREEILTLPNLISLARLGCIPWFAWLLLANEDRIYAGLLLGIPVGWWLTTDQLNYIANLIKDF